MLHLRLLLPAALALTASVWFGFLAAHGNAGKPLGLVIDENPYDFGTVSPTSVMHAYVLTNLGSSTVKFNRVEQNCGCTKIALSPKLLQPNESVRVPCEFDLAGRRGSFATGFTVYYSVSDESGTEKTIRVGVRASVIPTVQLAPESIEFVDGTSAVKNISVTTMEADKVVFTRASPLHRAISANIGDHGKAISVEFDASKWLDGPGTLTLRLETSSRTEPVVPLPVRIVRSIAIDPPPGTAGNDSRLPRVK